MGGGRSFLEVKMPASRVSYSMASNLYVEWGMLDMFWVVVLITFWTFC